MRGGTGCTGRRTVQKIFQRSVQKTVIPFVGTPQILKRIQVFSPSPFLFMEFCVKYTKGRTEETVRTLTIYTITEKAGFETIGGGYDGSTEI